MFDYGRKNALTVSLLMCFTLLFVLLLQNQSYGESGKLAYVKVVSKEIKYGNGDGQVGVISDTLDDSSEGLQSSSTDDDESSSHESEVFPEGPESFSIDSKDNVYVLDNVNSRIVVFSPYGDFKRNIAIDGQLEINDVAVDKSDNIFVYSLVQNAIYRLDVNSNGTKNKKAIFKDRINIQPLLDDLHISLSIASSTIGPMQIVGENIYGRIEDFGSLAIGKMISGQLKSLKSIGIQPSLIKGNTVKSGCIYEVHLSNEGKGSIEITKNGRTKTVELPVKGIARIVFLQEDKYGNFYIQTEYIDNSADSNGITLEVYKFNNDGQLLTEKVALQNDGYDFWTRKRLFVNENGDIYQFSPGKNNVILHVYKELTVSSQSGESNVNASITENLNTERPQVVQ